MSKKELTPFGVEMSDGANIRILSNAKEFFYRAKGIHIHSYKFTKSTPTRPKESLPSKALKHCSVCGQSLYSFSPSPDDPSTAVVRASAHLVFRDSMGERYHTCFKFKSCLKQVGFISSNGPDILLTPPEFERFHNLQPSCTEHEKEAEQLLRASYDKNVLPFLRKWCNIEISKADVMEFIRDLREAQDAHLQYFEGMEARKVIAKKLLTAVGVHNE